MTPLDLLRLAAEAEASPDAGEVEGTGWAAELLAGLPDERLDEIPESPGSSVSCATTSAAGSGGCSSSPGSASAAASPTTWASARPPPRSPTCSTGPGPPHLVVCPLTRRAQLETGGGPVHPARSRGGPPRRRARARVRRRLAVRLRPGAHLVITTYGLLPRDLETPRRRRLVDRLVLDEAQTVKNPNTEAARAVRQLRAGQKLALTGTPVENRLVGAVVDPRRCQPGAARRAPEVPRALRAPRSSATATKPPPPVCARITQPFILRRTKADKSLLPDLPDKIEQIAWAHAHPRAGDAVPAGGRPAAGRRRTGRGHASGAASCSRR